MARTTSRACPAAGISSRPACRTWHPASRDGSSPPGRGFEVARRGSCPTCGNPRRDAVYLTVTPARNDDRTVDRLDVPNVPVDAFWSISVCNAEGHFQKSDLDAYSLNSLAARKAGTARFPSSSAAATGNSKLPADHERRELHGAALSPAQPNPRRHLEAPGRSACGVKPGPAARQPAHQGEFHDSVRSLLVRTLNA